jgi:hypothetical protein
MYISSNSYEIVFIIERRVMVGTSPTIQNKNKEEQVIDSDIIIKQYLNRSKKVNKNLNGN